MHLIHFIAMLLNFNRFGRDHEVMLEKSRNHQTVTIAFCFDENPEVCKSFLMFKSLKVVDCSTEFNFCSIILPMADFGLIKTWRGNFTTPTIFVLLRPLSVYKRQMIVDRLRRALMKPFKQSLEAQLQFYLPVVVVGC